MTDTPTQVQDDATGHRYTAHVDGALAGFTQYRREEDRITFVHTEVDDAYEGQGVASALVRGALDDARRQGLSVVAQCEYVAGWVQRHPDYQDLLAA